AHDFNVALAFGVKVRAALTTPHRQCGQRILEYLLEGQKFQDAQVDRGMKTETTFIWANGAIHLYAIAAVNLNLSPITDPSNPELNDPLRLQHPLQQAVLHVFGVLLQKRPQAEQNFFYGLMKFGFVGIALANAVEHMLKGFTHSFRTSIR